jgi:hypothetical protein
LTGLFLDDFQVWSMQPTPRRVGSPNIRAQWRAFLSAATAKNSSAISAGLIISARMAAGAARPALVGFR